MDQFGSWTTSRAVAEATAALQRLKALGIPTPHGNRLEQSRDLLRRVERFSPEIGEADPELYRFVLEASRTVFEQHLIISYIQPPSSEIAAKLETMIRGHVVPIEGRFDPARDAQAELFAGVLFRAAGYYVDVAEPDLIIRKGKYALGVAVKRVTSTRQFRRRVKKAQEQLASQNLDGYLFIVADALVPDLRQSFAESPMDLRKEAEDWISYVENRPEYDRVLAVIPVATSFRLIRGGRNFLLGLTVHFHPLFVADYGPSEFQKVHAAANQMRLEMLAGLRRLGLAP